MAGEDEATSDKEDGCQLGRDEPAPRLMHNQLKEK